MSPSDGTPKPGNPTGGEEDEEGAEEEEEGAEEEKNRSSSGDWRARISAPDKPANPSEELPYCSWGTGAGAGGAETG
jgi:hypothetical protein